MFAAPETEEDLASRTALITPSGNVGTWNRVVAPETRTSRIESKDWNLIHRRNLKGPFC